MARFISIPPMRVEPEALQALLEEYASRDGTDYGYRETPLDLRVRQLMSQLRDGSLQLLYETQSEQFDLLPAEEASALLEAQESEGDTDDG